jgi:pilus assembly protein FimV
MSAPAPQPAAVANDVAAAATPTSKPANANARVAGARLEIAPPVGGAQTPGTQSGASAGGEGDMVRQELQQTKEDLAARNAEVDELKARVAELEKLQADQAALIQMKDSRLAAAEQNLAKANATTAAAPATTTKPAQPEQAASAPMWLWGGAGLVVIGLLAWLFSRRRVPVSAAPSRRGYDTEAMAAGMPKAVLDDADEPLTSNAAPPPAFAEVGRAQAPRPQAATDWTAAPAALGSAPTWHAGGAPRGGQAAIAEPETAAQQLELARAYLDMGDDDAARVVLREVLDSRDAAARDAAARMLRDL